MKTAWWSLMVGFAVVAAGQGSAVAAGGSCARLRGHDLAPAKSVKLVARGDEDDGDLASCSLPHGHIRVLATSVGGDMYSESFRVRQVAGAFAAVTTSFGDQYAAGERTAVVDLRSGRSRPIAAYQHDVGQVPPAPEPQAVAVFVTAGGRAAASVVDPTSGAVRIVALGPRGAAQQLDTGTTADLAAQSLTLTGATLGWTHAGVARTAPLP